MTSMESVFGHSRPKRLSLASTLLNVTVYAWMRGIVLKLHRSSQRTIELDLIQRQSAPKGAGADIMRLLCGTADRYHCNIMCYVFAAEPTLMEYYIGFGFETKPGVGDEAAMHRLPVKTTAANTWVYSH